MITTKGRRPETVAEKWHRLARLAREQNVLLLTESASGERFAMSVSQPGKIHRLTPNGFGFTCSCEGFLRWNRCKHAAALLEELGWLRAVERTPASIATCPTCHGSGIDPACSGHPVAGMTIHCPCYACDGSGTVAVHLVTAA